ncbi:unnamed protein product [Triticum turgidum subsp. durum]|uniref:Peptidase A1 domain-containing protein n=1 Tax=Triticum turgidum subsp. durum TaxID=4567 RepID=A0A9R0RJR1_TRITD|nr:unnamed protein product [Triticum turgidum subsp. durum]
MPMAPPPLLPLSALLLLLAAASHASAKPVQTQALLATPLSPDRVSAPSELARDDDSNVFAAAEDAAASTVRFRVVHRDDFSKNATAAELLAYRLERDEKRAARLSAAAGAANGTRRGGGGVVAPVVSGLAQGSGEYFTKIGVGTPATPALMVLDTGSDVVWLQCAPCRRCYEQSGQVFDPRRSRSYGAVGCAAPLCRRLDSGGCDLRRSACLYQVTYGDGSVTAGDFATETLSPGGFSLFDTCYDLSGRKVVKVPTVSMHFAGGAEAALPPENYLIPVDSKGTFCFAFAGTDGGVSIIGNIQQQGFRVVFDGDGQRVAFVPKGC